MNNGMWNFSDVQLQQFTYLALFHVHKNQTNREK